MRVLVTGAAGRIGRTVCTGLAERGHAVRALDLQPLDAAYALGSLVGDCADPAVAGRAVDGVEGVVHLAGNAGEAALPDELTSHVLSTAALLDAMRKQGVRRIVYASSNHAVGMHGRPTDDHPLGTDVRPRPDTHYGVAKVATEALLSLHVDRGWVEAVCLRIGTFAARPRTQRALATWLSPGDCVRLVVAALTAPDVGFTVAYGISANTRAWWDLASARAIGFEPVDDAERWADQVEFRPEDAAQDARVGGSFALPGAARPALD